MKHLQFRHWILDDIVLKPEERKILKEHLAGCRECRQLEAGWEASRKMLVKPVLTAPLPGFADRWQSTLDRKIRTEKVRRYRLTVSGFVLLGFVASLVYMIASGSFLHVLADSFNSLTHFLIAITNGLSTLGLWLGRLPIAVPIAAGFILFGLLTAFLMTMAFALWNINNRKKLAHETVSN
jgi:anti-sigma factor RsiW